MRLAEGRAAWHGGAHGASDLGVEEVHIQTNMKASVCRRHAVKKRHQGRFDPALVNRAHVVDVEV